MGLAELKAELAELEPILAEIDEALSEALAEKEAAVDVYEAAKQKVRFVNSERDPVRQRIMAIQNEIGQIEGIPSQKVG